METRGPNGLDPLTEYKRSKQYVTPAQDSLHVSIYKCYKLLYSMCIFFQNVNYVKSFDFCPGSGSTKDMTWAHYEAYIYSVSMPNIHKFLAFV